MMDITGAIVEGCEVGQVQLVFSLPDFDARGTGAETLPAPRPLPSCERTRRTSARHPIGERTEQPGSPPYEERLIAHCLRGDPAAWRTLFELYQPRFLIIIKTLLRNGSGAEQAEEIAAAVWSSLCSEGYSRLRRYDPRAGRLLGFLASMARREIWKGKRSEERRHSRECRAARKEATRDEVNFGLAFNEFLATLTGREREFCLSELLRQAEGTTPLSPSAAYGWQLRCRVRKKFRIYFLQKK